MSPDRSASRSSQHVVRDSGAAKLLLDERERRYLGCFFRAPRTVSDVARALGEDRGQVLYRVRKLHRHGLLRVARHETRAGRAIKHYQTSAERFVVPYAASDASSAEGFLALIEGTLRDAFYAAYLPEEEAFRTGVAFSDAPREGDVAMRLVTRRDDGWHAPGDARSETDVLEINLLALPHEEIVRLKRDLTTLLERYRAREVEGESLCLLRFGLVKVGGEAG